MIWRETDAQRFRATTRGGSHGTQGASPQSSHASAAANQQPLQSSVVGPSGHIEPRFFVTTEFQAQALMNQLLQLRSERLALLLTTFPLTHWLTIGLAGCSILVAFLVESDSQVCRLTPQGSTHKAQRLTPIHSDH